MPEQSRTAKKRTAPPPVLTAPLLTLCVFVAMYFSRVLLTGTVEGGGLLLGVSVVQLLVLLLPCMLYYLLKGRKLASPIPFSPVTPRHLTLLLFGALTFVLGSLLLNFCCQFFAIPTADTAGYYAQLYTGDEGSLAGVLLAFVVIPAVCEEVLFRGVLFAEYRPMGEWNAVFMTALCFAMLHFSFSGFPAYLLAGLLLGVVTAASRSIVPAVLLHLLSNALSLFASDRFLRVILQKNGAFFVGFLLVLLFGAALFLFLYCVEHLFLYYAEHPPEDRLPPKSRAFASRVFLSPTFLLLCAVFFVLTLLSNGNGA